MPAATILAGHGVGHADEMSGDGAGAAFGRQKDGIWQRALKRAEGRAVNGVDDDGNAGAARRQTAQDSGFAAVRMDDARAGLAENSGQTPPARASLNRMNGTNQGREDGQESGIGLEGGFQRAFRPGGRPGKRLTSMPGLF